MPEDRGRKERERPGGAMPKNDRIKRLLPLYAQGRIYLPESLFRTDWQGREHDLVTVFIEEEYKPFPVMLHDDMLDSKSRLFDLYEGGLPFPMEVVDDDDDAPRGRRDEQGSWMGM